MLERYPWCGHGVLMGRFKNDWQDWNYVLSWFGKKEGPARNAYRQYVQEGIPKGRRPELVGGGLIRSQGGWSQVISMRRRNEREVSDERILGSGDFVERMIQEADENFRQSILVKKKGRDLGRLIRAMCDREGISMSELKSGSRRGKISEVRSHLAVRMVEDCGLSLAATARELGVSTSGISRLLERRNAR